jgi:hypothetical protein
MILHDFHIKYDVRNTLFIHVTFYDQRISKYGVATIVIFKTMQDLEKDVMVVL